MEGSILPLPHLAGGLNPTIAPPGWRAQSYHCSTWMEGSILPLPHLDGGLNPTIAPPGWRAQSYHCPTWLEGSILPLPHLDGGLNPSIAPPGWRAQSYHCPTWMEGSNRSSQAMSSVRGQDRPAQTAWSGRWPNLEGQVSCLAVGTHVLGWVPPGSVPPYTATIHPGRARSAGMMRSRLYWLAQSGHTTGC